MLLAATLLAAAAWTSPLSAPRAGVALATATVGPAVFAAPRAAAARMGFMSKVKELNEANKMQMVTRTAPKVRPVRLPPDVLEITTRFKKEYPCAAARTLHSLHNVPCAAARTLHSLHNVRESLLAHT